MPIVRLLDPPGVAAVRAGRQPGLARPVRISVPLAETSSAALALVLDRSNTLGRLWPECCFRGEQTRDALR